MMVCIEDLNARTESAFCALNVLKAKQEYSTLISLLQDSFEDKNVAEAIAGDVAFLNAMSATYFSYEETPEIKKREAYSLEEEYQLAKMRKVAELLKDCEYKFNL